MTANADRAPSGDRRIRVISNPKAGSTIALPTNQSGSDAVREVIARHALPAELVESGSEEDAVQLTREAVRAGYDVVVAAGGDGTVSIVAEQLIGTKTALGILPMGSVMNIARSLGIPRDLDEAADLIVEGHVRTMDIGEANGKLFYEATSVGLSAELFSEAQRLNEGEYGGLVAAIGRLLAYRPHRVRLLLGSDEAIEIRAFLVAVANGPYTGFGFTVAPDAELDDGMFDIAVFRRFSRVELLRHFASIALGRRAYNPKVSTYRSARIRVESRVPLAVRADGTDLGTTPVDCAVRPRALRALVPAPRRVAETDGSTGAAMSQRPGE